MSCFALFHEVSLVLSYLFRPESAAEISTLEIVGRFFGELVVQFEVLMEGFSSPEGFIATNKQTNQLSFAFVKMIGNINACAYELAALETISAFSRGFSTDLLQVFFHAVLEHFGLTMLAL